MAPCQLDVFNLAGIQCPLPQLDSREQELSHLASFEVFRAICNILDSFLVKLLVVAEEALGWAHWLLKSDLQEA